jgi:hypothetical protein
MCLVLAPQTAGVQCNLQHPITDCSLLFGHLSLLPQQQVESATSLSSLQQSLASFRCVLHDQLAAELAVGQAALQLFAASQQQRQQHDQQHTHEQQQDALAKLRQQLESCHFAALWGQRSSSSSSGVQEGVDSKQQLLQLLVSTLLVGPLAVVSELVGQAGTGDGCVTEQLQQQGEDGTGFPKQQQQQQACTSVLEQLLQAAVAGVGQPEHPGGADKQQQQQQHGLESALSLLLSQLLQPCCSVKVDQQANCDLQQQSAGNTAVQGAAEAATSGIEVCGDPVAGVQLAAFTRGLCNLLLLRLLSRAPPCESWSWEACLAVTQLLVSSEQAAAAAGGLMYQALSQHPTALQWASKCGDASLGSSKQPPQDQELSVLEHWQHQRQQQTKQQQDEDGQAGAVAGAIAQGDNVQQDRTSKVLQAGMLLYSRQLQGMLQQLHIAEQALEACQSSSTSSSTPSSSTPGSSTSHTPVSKPAVQSQQQQQQQQQQEPEKEFAAPSFWRSLLLSMYQKSRPLGSGFFQQCFPAFGADNDNPGFWALVGVGLVHLGFCMPGCWALVSVWLLLGCALCLRGRLGWLLSGLYLPAAVFPSVSGRQ